MGFLLSLSLLTQTHTHTNVSISYPPPPPIHPFIHTSLPKEGEERAKKKKQLERATAACELEDPIGLFFSSGDWNNRREDV